jgi:predicted methyltransferase
MALRSDRHLATLRSATAHLTDPKDIDASLYRALKPGGELAILDFRPTWLLAPWTPKAIPANRGGHGIPPTIVVDEVTAAGFKLEQTVDPLSVLASPSRIHIPVEIEAIEGLASRFARRRKRTFWTDRRR